MPNSRDSLDSRYSLRRSFLLAATFALAAVAAGPAQADTDSYTLFESGQVRPLALSPDGSLLFACNTPDNRLEIFSTALGSLSHVGSVEVGLEPVAVAARSNTEVWVVNHLSDSVSVVDVSTPASPRVVRTLLVGDEPRDVVFAGTGGDRAFITTAHRGQNSPVDPELTTEGVGRADVWVFDAGNLGSSLGGDELTIVTLFGDTPRALAVSPDGTEVYAAVFHSGNQTTALSEGVVSDGPGLPPPTDNFQGVSGPSVGLIVKFDGADWVDELDRSWTSDVKFSLPDHDVFVIDADANPPDQVGGASGFFAEVGTILFNMAVNPVSGKVYVSNTEAFNEVRFEGPGTYAGPIKPVGEPATVRGHLHESRITVLDGSTATPRHLNKHIDYTSCCAPIPNAENADSLAFPLDMAVSGDGSTLYVAAFGSSKIGVFDTTELENDTFVPDDADHINVGGGGPTGLVLDETNGQLYVLARFDNSVSVFSTGTGMLLDYNPLHNPEPDSVVDGRPFLYDAAFTSAHGDSACASCHVFGDFDSLAWDLGNPDDVVLNNPGPFSLGPFGDPDFHPMKGPMTTQSFRGMDNHGPMHWRGDRTGGNDAASSQPDSGSFDEDAAFKKFNPAFEGLIGRSEELTANEMQAYTDFVLQINYPPNPIRALDNALSTEEQAGNDFYFGPVSDTFFDCNGCHTLNVNGNAGFGVERPGFFGGDGRSSFENEPQHFKVPHLRNMYQKVGMFGMADVDFFNSSDDNSFQGDQVRGFGFLHDGSVDTLFRFHGADVFSAIPNNASGDQIRRELEAFMLAFDSNHAPIVGQQITRTNSNGATADPRIDLLVARANANECDLVAKGEVAGIARGYLYNGVGQFEPDRAAEPNLTDAALRALANTAGQEITYTCAPVGSGQRMALDRDEDTYYDRDELDGGSDPADPASVPAVCGDGTIEQGEQCDGVNLGGQTCASLGFDGGALACDGSCQFDTSGCYSCGDGNIDPGEQCDGANLDGETCVSQGFDAGTLACDGSCQFDTSACTFFTCGDNNVDPGEQCDGTDLDGETCVSQGFDGGALACSGTCTFDTSGCFECGDNNADPGEDCDGPDLAGETCVSQGFGGGTLACDGTCGFDTSGCYDCGDGNINPGEDCDGANLGGEDCVSQGFDTGTLACDAGCQFDTSGCMLFTCGDGIVDPGEQCDGTDLDGETCLTLGFDGGTLSCSGNCELDTSDCTFAVCGDGNIDVDEDCDGANLGGEDCVSQGFIFGGTLACDGSCGFDSSSCVTLHDTFAAKNLKISKLTKPAGQQKLGIKSDEMDGAGIVFNPLTEALTIEVSDGGSPVWQATIGAGDPDWKLAGNRLKWKAKTGPHPDGLSQVQIGISGQPFTVKVKAKDIDASGVGGAGSLTVTLIVGNDAWSGPTPCETSGSGSAIKCR